MPPALCPSPREVTEHLRGTAYDAAPAGLVAALRGLLADGLDVLPLPGRGRTLERWRVLAAVAAHDVALVKLVEGHTDAVAILAELGGAPPEPGCTWGVWAAEPPDAQALASPAGPGLVRLDGRKAWCSGATELDNALVTCRGPGGERLLAAVALAQPGVVPKPAGWAAVGMAATGSVDVVLDGALATVVGGDGEYLRRSGFHQGGAGIAACWHGAAAGVAAPLLTTRRGDGHAAAHLGAADTALAGSAAVLREAAAGIDAAPSADTSLLAARARSAAELTVDTVLRAAGRALGAAPLCRDAEHARRVADLTVFVRQSHAERDLAAQAALVTDGSGWVL